MDKKQRQLYVTPSGERSSLIDKIFYVYLRLALAWVIFALGFDIVMIIKHFKEFGFN
jgi:hypothetical protein